MKIIPKLSWAGLAVALTASASAFPYSVSPHTGSPTPTIALSVHHQGVGQQKNNASVKETGLLNRTRQTPHWR